MILTIRITSRSIVVAILRPKSYYCSLLHNGNKINCIIPKKKKTKKQNQKTKNKKEIKKKKNCCYPYGGRPKKKDKEGARGSRGYEKGKGLEPAIIGTSSKWMS